MEMGELKLANKELQIANATLTTELGSKDAQLAQNIVAHASRSKSEETIRALQKQVEELNSSLKNDTLGKLRSENAKLMQKIQQLRTQVGLEETDT